MWAGVYLGCVCVRILGESEGVVEFRQRLLLPLGHGRERSFKSSHFLLQKGSFPARRVGRVDVRERNTSILIIIMKNKSNSLRT